MSIKHVLEAANLGEFDGWTAQYLDPVTGRWVNACDWQPRGLKNSAVQDARDHHINMAICVLLQQMPAESAPVKYRLLHHVIRTEAEDIEL